MSNDSKQAPLIDIDMLTMALQAGDLDTSWWLDTHSGDVIPAPEDSEDVTERKLIRKQQQNPERYIAIEPIDEAIHIELMESYVATLEEQELCDALYAALKKKQPSWHFKNALARAPESEDNWYAFKEQFYALQARQWLRDRSLDFREFQTDEDTLTVDAPAAMSNRPLLELSVKLNNAGRRYLVSRYEHELLLSVFMESQGQPAQLLAEMTMNEYQLQGLNNILETYRPYIDTGNSAETADATMSFSAATTSGQIQGNHADTPFQQLLTAMDLLLGIPPLKV